MTHRLLGCHGIAGRKRGQDFFMLRTGIGEPLIGKIHVRHWQRICQEPKHGIDALAAGGVIDRSMKLEIQVLPLGLVGRTAHLLV